MDQFPLLSSPMRIFFFLVSFCRQTSFAFLAAWASNLDRDSLCALLEPLMEVQTGDVT